MTANLERGSAKIYPFPARGRFAAGVRLDDSTASYPSTPIPTVTFGSGWYHEEAVQEERTRKD
jgi:hypothetical protein